MNASQIQALLLVNAAHITSLHIDIEDGLEDANDDFGRGEIAFALATIRRVKNIRVRLAKSVKLQNTMKTELKGIHRSVRIVSKTAKLAKLGMTAAVLVEGRTSMEIEADLDEVLALMTMKKPDSRIAA